ncbi:MAG: (d)CMP kinase [Saprospiraceae bacterium]
MKKIIIAIDGPSASGKSTLAKDLAARLDYTYVDSGAMYRAVTLFFLQQRIPIDNLQTVQHALEQITIRVERDERGNRTILNGKDVEDAIRQMEVSEMVSPVAAIAAVRVAMVQQQQAMGKHKGVVMDGRDIGTVVFPQAELKLFVTADLEARAQRRYAELIKKNQQVSFEEILDNLRERDHIDSTRAISPLRKADDAFEIDNTHLGREEQLKLALELVNQKTGVQVS